MAPDEVIGDWLGGASSSAPREVAERYDGTGLVGRELRTHGYAGRLHGLDLSETSLAIAAASGAYDEGPAVGCYYLTAQGL